MANDGGNVVPRVAKAEHIGPADTGDNIEAKRVAGYVWNGSTWERESNSKTTKEQNQLVPFAHDFIDLNYTGADLTSVVFKTGGSGGTTVATLTLAYASGQLDTVTRS